MMMRHTLAKSLILWHGVMGSEQEHEESRRTTGMMRTENGDKPFRIGGQLFTLGLNLVAPIALYYGLRAVGIGIYLALIVGAVAPALGAVVKLIRRERLDFLGLYMMTMLLLGAAVALLTGSPRFLLAKDGWLTGASGVWMLLSVRSQRPLTFLFARPLLEGVTAKMAGAAGASWDTLCGKPKILAKMCSKAICNIVSGFSKGAYPMGHAPLSNSTDLWYAYA